MPELPPCAEAPEASGRTRITVRITHLSTCSVGPDGSGSTFGMVAEDGTEIAVQLPLACVGQLVLTLPRMLDHMLKLQHSDPSLRYVFPLGDATIEKDEVSGSAIIVLSSSDGFHVSFSLPFAQLADLTRKLDVPAPAPTRLN